jgi:hypothetical protein
LAPQLIAPSLEVTVPPRRPVFVTVKVTFTVKLFVLVAVPPGVLTLSGPVVAPVGTVAWIAVAEVTVKLALTALNVTPVAPVKFVPLIVTLLPTGPLVGVKLVIVGGALTTVKLFVLVAVPPGVLTLSGPVVAPAGTVAWIAVAEVTVKLALTALNATPVAPLKFVPLIVTLLPTGPLVGVKLVIVGGALTTVKLFVLVAVPPGVLTLSGPVVAPAGTVAWIAVAELTVKLALSPLKLTAVAPVKFVPLIVTLVPTGPLVGVKPVIVGAGITVKLVALVAVPPGVVTRSGPVVAPVGTVAWIAVAEVTVKLALTVLNVTAVAPVKFVPLIVTLLPTGPLVGVKPVIVGGALLTTVNPLPLVAVPPGVVTRSGPVVAPVGTVAWIAVAEVTVKLALTALNVTAVAPVKFVPLIVTLVPTGPLAGAKLVIVGAGVVPPAVSPPSHPVKVKFEVSASIPTSPVG